MQELHMCGPQPSEASRSSPGDPLVGRTFNGRFRIESRLAKGGMGKVYRAVQVPLGRPVALKVLNVALTQENTEDFHRRFFLEAATAARLSHPHTVTIFDYGCSDDGIYYIAMEYLEGQSLRQVLRTCGRLAAHRAVPIAIQMARAIREAHALGVVHRDLKPANVMLLADDDGRDFVKVLDFGLAKSAHACDDLTRTGQFLGSPGYMAPEQIRGQALDLRCDIYALGAMLFEMLTGRSLFPRSGPMETLMAHVHEPVPAFATACPGLQLPAALEAAVLSCLSKRPEDRPADMSTVMLRLRQAVVDLPPPSSSLHPRHEYESSGWAVVPPTGALRRSCEPSGWHGHEAAAPTQLAIAAQDKAIACAPNLRGLLFADTDEATLGVAEGGGPALQSAEITRTALHAHEAGVSRGGDAETACVLHERSTLGDATVVVRPIGQRRRGGSLGVILCVSLLIRGPFEPTAADSTVQPVVLHLRSQPSGAGVWLRDTLVCAATPCDVDYVPAAQQGTLCLRFLAEGFEEYFTNRRLQPRAQTITGALEKNTP